MRYLKLPNITPGMVLARPILDDNGRLMIREGMTLTEVFLKKINDMSLQGLYIEERGFEDIVVEDVIPEELRLKAYNALKAGEYDKCVAIANKIVYEMTHESTINMDLLDIKSDKDYEYRHCISVAVFATAIGINMDLKEDQLNQLCTAGLLHDIGKFDVKKKVMSTRSIYSDKQMDEMKKHPMYSFEALKGYPTISAVARNAILFHHENLDGSGYYGASADKLGIFPRILRVADTYDALTATRKHREAFSPRDAIDCLLEDAGKIYDKDVVRTFGLTFPIYPKGFTIELANGQQGVIVDNRQNNRRPLIRLLSGEEINLASNPGYKDIKIEDIV